MTLQGGSPMSKPWSCHPAASRGRRHAEAPAPTRDDFQRDRDRIVHSTAFRRLVYKTQVFLNHEGDLFRTRLTHSLEVAQLARSMARAIGLNEDLVEAIALAHDLGHTPFGHAGQDALHERSRLADPVEGGFEHNYQSLRVVDTLEERYPAFDGLNLTFETREGILKRCSQRNARRLCELEPGGVAQRFLDGTQPSLEAQLCNLADEIAYNAHDADDGVRSGLITIEQLEEVPLFGAHARDVRRSFSGLAGRRVLFETVRRMLSEQVYDVVATTDAAVRNAGPASVDEVRKLAPLVGFSPAMQAANLLLKKFLFDQLYRHAQVEATTQRGKDVIAELFDAYRAEPSQMPPAFAERPDTVRAVTDYIAGMTDRFALKEHHRLTGRTAF